MDLYLQSQKTLSIRVKNSSISQSLSKTFRRVRKQGYGFSDEEIARGVRALAARDSKGNVVASIRMSLPTFELPNSKIKRTAKVVRETAREVSRQLGWEDTQE